MCSSVGDKVLLLLSGSLLLLCLLRASTGCQVSFLFQLVASDAGSSDVMFQIHFLWIQNLWISSFLKILLLKPREFFSQEICSCFTVSIFQDILTDCLALCQPQKQQTVVEITQNLKIRSSFKLYHALTRHQALSEWG